MRSCATCKQWRPLSAGVDFGMGSHHAPDTFGLCVRFSHNDSRDVEGVRMDIQDDDLAGATDASGLAAFRTRAEFGCVQHEEVDS